MNRFIKFLLLYYIAPIAIIFSLAFIAASKKYPVTEAQLQLAYTDQINTYDWVNNVDSVDGFILGSSTLRYGLSSRLLQKDSQSAWINFAFDARDPIACYLLLKKFYLVKRPKCILMGLDPFIYAKKYYVHLNKIMYRNLTGTETFRFYNKDKQVYYKKAMPILQKYLLPLPDSELVRTPEVMPDDYGSKKLTRAAKNFKDIKEDWFEIKKGNSIHKRPNSELL